MLGNDVNQEVTTHNTTLSNLEKTIPRPQTCMLQWDAATSGH